MANGERFNMNNAHIVATADRSIPFGTLVELENPKNGRRLKAVVCDRMAPEWGKTDPKRIDLSLAGAKKLGYVKEGVTILRARFQKR